MKLTKKLAALAVALTMAIGTVGMTASALNDEQVSGGGSGDMIVGGWSVSTIGADTMTSDEMDILDAAMDGMDGISYDGVATMATHTDEDGTDYAFLCLAAPVVPDATPDWYVMSVFEDTDGIATLTAIKHIDYAAIGTLGNAPDLDEDSWKVVTGRSEDSDTVWPDDIETALSFYVGASFEPLAILATQSVSGTNYRCLATGTLATENPSTYVYVVDISADLNHNVAVVDADVLDFSEYCVKYEKEEEPTPIVGGWTFSGISKNYLSDEEKKIFADATEGLAGVDIDPVDVIATQVVGGLNLAYLCTVTPVVPDAESHWAIATIYADPSLSAELLGIKDIDIADVEVLAEAPAFGVPGAWQASQDEVSADLADEIEGAMAELAGVDYDPIAVLGTQEVAGVNYRILTYGKPVVPDAVTQLYVMDVYVAPDGSGEIRNVDYFDLEAYITKADIQDSDESDESETEESKTEESKTEESKTEESKTDSKKDTKSDTNPKTGAAVLGIGAVVLAAAAVTATKKRK